MYYTRNETILYNISFYLICTIQDSVRITDLSNISKQLQLMLVKAGKVYIPENKVDITASGTVILYQGEMGLDTLSKLRVYNGGIDPVDKSPYIYSTNKNLTKYELMGFLENGNQVGYNNQSPHSISPKGREVATIFPQANAATNLINRFPVVKGDSIGIILNPTTNEPINSTGVGVDIVNTNTTYKILLDNSSSGSITGTGVSLPMLLSKGYNLKTCKDVLNLYGNGIKDGTYTINPTGKKSFDVYCDMTTDGGGWTRVLDYNGNSLNKNLINASDWYQDSNNYSYLYTFKDIKKTTGEYEFLVRGYKGNITRWLQFTQTNSYDQDPNNNNFKKIAGNFVFFHNNTIWKGLALGIYGNISIQSFCPLSISYGANNNVDWWNCIIDNYSGFNTGPWSTALNPNDIIYIYQR